MEGAGGDSFALSRSGALPQRASGPGELLFTLEKDLTLELQRLRRDLYFLHAAALERDGCATLLLADSGVGKSTTAWALSHRGFRYLSDELAPLDGGSLEVAAYPHALCLKARPPAAFPLPPETLETEWTLHVPADRLPGGVATRARLDAIFFLTRDADAAGGPARVRALTAAEAGARLLTGALNPLAHPEAGLDTALAIAAAADCYELALGDLSATCDTAVATLDARPARS